MTAVEDQPVAAPVAHAEPRQYLAHHQPSHSGGHVPPIIAASLIAAIASRGST
jgi:hypothetical protein